MSATQKYTNSPPEDTCMTINLSDADRHVLTFIQDRYGLPTMSAALGYAVRRLQEVEEQVTLLTEQLASLQRELAQMHEGVLALHQEQECMLKEMQSLNEELQFVTAVSPLAQCPSSEWSVFRQQGKRERDTARRMRVWAQQVREDTELQLQQWNEKMTRLMGRTRGVLTLSHVRVPPYTVQQKETS